MANDARPTASTIRSWVGSHPSPPESSTSGWSRTRSLIRRSSMFSRSAIRRKMVSTIASCSRWIHPPVDVRVSALDPLTSLPDSLSPSPLTLLADTVERSMITSPLEPDARSIRCCTSTGDKNLLASRMRGAQLRTLRVSRMVVPSSSSRLSPFFFFFPLGLLDWYRLISASRSPSTSGR